MSHSIIHPPVHETSPPPLDDDNDENDNENNFIGQPLPSVPLDEDLVRENSSSNDNENNEDWQSVDENQENPITPLPDEEPPVVEQKEENDFGWANFTSFEPKTEESAEGGVTSPGDKSNDEDDGNWAFFESPTVPSTEPEPEPEPEPVVSSPSPPSPAEGPVTEAKTDGAAPNVVDDDDDFGEFSEVQISSDQPPSPPPPPPAPAPTASLPIEHLSSEKIESLISACFPVDSSISSSMSDRPSHFPTLPSFTTLKSEEKTIDYLEPSLSLWKVLSNLSSDPVGVTFQWRKSNTERLLHHALGVSERFRTKTVPLTPEVLQPEKVRPIGAITGHESDQNNHDSKIPSPSVRPHFDWKQSGLENPLADNDSSSLSSNLSKNEEISTGFDANKTLDLDFYVPPVKPAQESERTASPSVSSTNESPIVPTQRSSIPIKTMDLFPGSTTTLNDDAKRILDSLPNLSFMSAKALMFPVRFNGSNHDESTSLY